MGTTRRGAQLATGLIQLQENIDNKFEEGKSSALLCYESSASHKPSFSRDSSSMVQTRIWSTCFSSYLKDRFQYCELGDKRSAITKILQGVFQGSALGPLLSPLHPLHQLHRGAERPRCASSTCMPIIPMQGSPSPMTTEPTRRGSRNRQRRCRPTWMHITSSSTARRHSS